eukprot:gb/GFBE01051743.1/.p1 GENE.gb/GFBE01051743.1/~~gb/GFBE01051743.1/.p1  ORF type:complete len:107 (+),score=15.58 gb/GFBE01051743.1/:1-321(+)
MSEKGAGEVELRAQEGAFGQDGAGHDHETGAGLEFVLKQGSTLRWDAKEVAEQTDLPRLAREIILGREHPLFRRWSKPRRRTQHGAAGAPQVVAAQRPAEEAVEAE